MLNLSIDGVAVSVTRIVNNGAWSSVYVNGNASCHSLPSHVLEGGTHRFKTGGHNYSITGVK